MNIRQLVSKLIAEARLVSDTRDNKRRYLVARLNTTAHPDHPNAQAVRKQPVGFAVMPVASGYSYAWDKFARQLNRKDLFDKVGDFWVHTYPHAAFIVDHDAGIVNFDTEEVDHHKNRRPSLKSQRTTYTILNTDPAIGVPENKVKLLLDVIKLDPPVANLKIAGTDQTVTQYLQANRTSVANRVSSPTAQPLYLYHGTSLKRWELIKKQGLKPGSTPASADGEAYGDQVAGYSEHNVYLTTTVSNAANYAARLASVDRSEAVILKVRVPDLAKLRPDEDTLWWLFSMPGGYELAQKLGIKNDSHFKHYGPRNPMPAELWKFYTSLTKHSLAHGTIAYNGWIHPSNIQFFKGYKIASMSRDPDDAEFNAAMAKSASTLRTTDQPARKTKAKAKSTELPPA